jgi:hypothetical protein
MSYDQVKRTAEATISAVVAVLAMSAVAAAQTNEPLQVKVYLAGTLRDGARGTHAVEDVPDAPGEASTWTVYAKTTDPLGVASGAVPAGWLAGYSHGWTLQLRRSAGEPGVARVDVEWSRKELAGGTVQAGDRRTIALKEGEHHILDFVPIPSGPYANVVLELEAVHVEEPQFQSEMLAYDLWLVHEGREGRVTRQVAVTGIHGQQTPYWFDPPRFPIGTAATDQPALELSVSGTVRGRVRPDGRLEVTLVSRRTLIMSAGLGALARRAHTGGADIGEKTFLASPGETIAVELPAPGGSFTLVPNFAIPVHLQPGVTVLGDRLHVSRAEFFGSGKTSILVTVRRR